MGVTHTQDEGWASSPVPIDSDRLGPRVRAASETLASPTTPATGVSRVPSWHRGGFVGAILMSIVGYAGFVAAYGVNVVYWDDWSWSQTLRRGTTTLVTLWLQHNEDRVFFPNIAAWVLVFTTHFNSFAFFWVSALCMCATLAVVIWALRSEVGRSPLLWLPVPFLVLTLAQWQTTLSAFEIAWAMDILFVAGTLALLSRPRPTGRRIAGAGALGILASYSLLQGLTVWPIGLLMLLARGQSKKWAIWWTAIGLVVTGCFFVDFDFALAGAVPLHQLLTQWQEVVEGVLIAQGSVVPTITSGVTWMSGTAIAEVIGGVLFAGAAVVVAAWLREHRPSGPKAFCIGLIGVSIVFDLLLAGRIAGAGGVLSGTGSRYDTFAWPLLVGLYGYAVIWARDARRKEPLVRAGQVLVSLIAVAAIAVGTVVGIAQGQDAKSVRLASADVLANWSTAPADIAAAYLLPPAASSPAVYAQWRTAAEFLQQRHLSVFANPAQVKGLQELGIVPEGVPTRLLAIPSVIRAQVDATPTSRLAWRVLSAAYFENPAIEKVYGQTRSGVASILDWAVLSADGVTQQEILFYAWYPPANDALFFQPYVPLYRQWELATAAG